MMNDGSSIWRGQDDELQIGETGLRLTERGSRATIHFPKDVPPYALEGLFTAASMRYGELRAFGDESPVPYLRGLTGPCVLTTDRGGINLYPVIKLYESGVLLVELRLFSGGASAHIDTGTLIHDYVRAQVEEYTEAQVPPAIADLAPIVSVDWKSISFFERLRISRARPGHRAAVEARIVADTSGDFEHLFCELPAFEGQTETIKNIALLIANIVGYLASDPRSGLRLAILGQRPLLTTSHWSGRPHVHLLKFSKQTDSAKTNEENLQRQLASILSGVPNAPLTFMTDNLRKFDDYGVYVTRSTQVWMYTPQILAAPDGTLADPNYGHVIYEQEVVAELLEYAYALNRRLEEEAGVSASNPRLVARLRILLVNLAAKVDAHVHSGEILEILRRGYVELRIPEIQKRTEDILAARMDLLTQEEDRRTTNWALVVSIIFGFLAVPPLANDVLAPLWRLVKWPIPSNADAVQLFLTAIATASVFAVVVLTRLLVSRRTK